MIIGNDYFGERVIVDNTSVRFSSPILSWKFIGDNLIQVEGGRLTGSISFKYNLDYLDDSLPEEQFF